MHQTSAISNGYPCPRCRDTFSRFPQVRMLHQRRLPPRDVPRNSQPQRGQDRSRAKKALIDGAARNAVTASGCRHSTRLSSRRAPSDAMDPAASPLAAPENSKPSASIDGASLHERLTRMLAIPSCLASVGEPR